MNEKVSILIVDDREQDLMVMEEILQSPDYDLVKASSGKEALQRLMGEDFALILLDATMPEFDGFETARIIKQREKSRHIPIIFLTAFGQDQKYVFEGYSAGAVDYLSKPVEPVILKAKVAIFVDLYKKNQELKTMSEAFKQLNQQNELILNTAGDGIFGLDSKGRFTFVNHTAAELLGYESEELIGQDSYAVLRCSKPDGNPYAEGERPIDSTYKEGVAREARDELFFRKDGASFPVEYLTAPALEEGGAIVGAVVVFKDITERKQAEVELRRMTALERSNADLEQFAYVASHDLQEPLRMVSSYVELLKIRYQDKLDTDANEFIDYAVDGAHRMKELINGLLALSRVGTRAKPLEATDCEVLLKHILDDLKLSIEESKAQVTSDPLPTLMADGQQLRELLQNLIENAIKFHGEAPPQVNISAERKEKDYVFSVRDNGIGVADEYVERIFGVFQRIHKRGEYPGTGIGLAVCKKIVERHGGRIWIESEPGQGSTFYFTIPADRPAAGCESQSKRDTHEEEANGKANFFKALSIADLVTGIFRLFGSYAGQPAAA